jgi:hypothetical protein
MSECERPKLDHPCERGKVLLHCCCAPCAGAVIEALLWSQIDHEIFFYNPNIHPRSEYLRRKGELQRFALAHGIAFVDADYDPVVWFERVQGLESEPERGARCAICFDVRLERAARHAHQNGFAVIATTLGISRWKNIEQIDASGRRCALSGACLLGAELAQARGNRTVTRSVETRGILSSRLLRLRLFAQSIAQHGLNRLLPTNCLAECLTATGSAPNSARRRGLRIV